MGGEPRMGAEGWGVWVKVSGGSRCALSYIISAHRRWKLEGQGWTYGVTGSDEVYSVRVQHARRIGSKKLGRQGKGEHYE
jgi:hypothetical protein